MIQSSPLPLSITAPLTAADPAIPDCSAFNGEPDNFETGISKAWSKEFPGVSLLEFGIRSKSGYGYATFLAAAAALGFAAGRKSAGSVESVFPGTHAATAAAAAQSPQIRTFADAVQAFVGLGVTQAEAVRLAAKDYPKLHDTYLKSGAGPIEGTPQKSNSKSSSGEKTFAALVAVQVESGKPKGAAIKSVMASHPSEYQTYLQTGGQF